MTNFILHVVKLNAFAAVIILLVLAAGRLLDKRYSNRWKYLIWLFVSVCLLIPMRIPDTMGVVKFEIPQSGGFLENNLARVDSLLQEGEKNSKDAKANIEDANNGDRTVNTEKNSWQMFMAKTGMEGKAGIDLAANVFLIIWLSGVCGFTVYRILICRAVYRRLSRWSVVVTDRKAYELYRKTARSMGIKKVPRLLISNRAEGPLLTGTMHTEIYLPKTPYTLEEFGYIFKHELQHYVHKDLWYKLVLLVVSTVYWFNPALCIMRREAERNIEFLCDEAVMRGKSREERLNYNQLLLKTASESKYELSASLNDGGLSFKKRMVNIMKAGKLKWGILPVICFVTVLTAANILIGCSVKEEDTNTKSKSVKTVTDSEKKKDKSNNKMNQSGTDHKTTTPSEKTSTPSESTTEPAKEPAASSSAEQPPVPQQTQKELLGDMNEERLPGLVQELGLDKVEGQQFQESGTRYEKNSISIEWQASSDESSAQAAPITVMSNGNSTVLMNGIYCGQPYEEARDKLVQEGWLVNSKENPKSFLRENEDGSRYNMELGVSGDNTVAQWYWSNWPQGNLKYFEY